MSSFWNNRISVSIFGESCGPAIGVTIDNLPPGEYIDIEELNRFMARRNSVIDSAANESRSRSNLLQIMSGVYNERTAGTPLCAFIQNTGSYVEDYSNLSKLARPGHADYTGAVRYKGFNDVRDGGHLSDKLTAPLCFAGAVCAQILERRGIYVGAHISEIHNIKDTPFNNLSVSREDILNVRYKEFPTINDKKGNLMLSDIRKAAEGGESLGGIVECAAVNVPAGIGSPIFDGLENSIAQLVFGIPAVKGLEFGSGFLSAKMVGSQNSDEFYVDNHGHVMTKTNNHGGIIDGISSGMPITLRVAFKPAKPAAQRNEAAESSQIKVNAPNIVDSHAPCVVHRAVPCVEAAVNIALLSHMIDYPNFC